MKANHFEAGHLFESMFILPGLGRNKPVDQTEDKEPSQNEKTRLKIRSLGCGDGRLNENRNLDPSSLFNWGNADCGVKELAFCSVSLFPKDAARLEGHSSVVHAFLRSFGPDVSSTKQGHRCPDLEKGAATRKHNPRCPSARCARCNRGGVGSSPPPPGEAGLYPEGEGPRRGDPTVGLGATPHPTLFVL